MADNIGVTPSIDNTRVDVATNEIGGLHYPVVKISTGPNGEQTPVSHDNPLPTTDFWLDHALHVIESTYGDEVSIQAKDKDLLKFGRNENVGTTEATIQHQPSGIYHETYVSDNLINSVISTDAGDTQDIVIEGHTISGGVFTFVVQSATLTGQTAVALSTPLARCTRLYNDDSTEMVGVISVTETDTYTAGVPDTDAKVHLQLGAGEQQSEKASTTISNTDYWILTRFYGDILEKTASSAEIHLEMRLNGKVFREVAMCSASSNHRGVFDFKPYFIVPKNSDIRLSAIADGANTDISGGMMGVLAVVV